MKYGGMIAAYYYNTASQTNLPLLMYVHGLKSHKKLMYCSSINNFSMKPKEKMNTLFS